MSSEDEAVLLYFAVAAVVMLLAFALIYRYAFAPADFGFKSEVDPYYFSLATSFNAYGDISPRTDKAKLTVMAQMTMSWLLLLYIATKFYSTLQRRSRRKRK